MWWCCITLSIFSMYCLYKCNNATTRRNRRWWNLYITHTVHSYKQKYYRQVAAASEWSVLLAALLLARPRRWRRGRHWAPDEPQGPQRQPLRHRKQRKCGRYVDSSVDRGGFGARLRLLRLAAAAAVLTAPRISLALQTSTRLHLLTAITRVARVRVGLVRCTVARQRAQHDAKRK